MTARSSDPPPAWGRDAALADVAAVLAAEGFVAVVGPAGIGKTHLARAHAEGTEGALWVDAGAARDVVDLATAIARAAGVALPSSRTIAQTIAHLAQALEPFTLLVVDEVEHCVTAASELLPRLEVPTLVTSRTPLTVGATRALPPLAVVPAVELLVERVRRWQPRWSPSDADRTGLGAIAAAVDGYPLALELAAEQLRVSTTDEVLAGLPGDHGSVVERAIRASLVHLPRATRQVALAASAFAGSFTRDDLSVVAAADGAGALVDALLLTTRSGLVRVLPTPSLDAPRRFSLLAPVRETLRHVAAEEGTRALHASRHRRLQLERARRFVEAFDDGLEALADDDASTELLAVARDPASSGDERAWAALAIDIPWRLAGRSLARGPLLEAALTPGPSDPGLRARLLSASSHARREGGDLDAAGEAAAAAVNAAEQADPRPRARALLERGVVAFLAKRLADAAHDHAAALAVAEAAGATALAAEILANHSTVALLEGRPTEGLERARASLAAAQRSGARRVEVFSLAKLAEALEAVGRLADARAALELALGHAAALEIGQLGISLRAHLASIKKVEGDRLGAHRDFAEALSLAAAAGHVRLERAIRGALAGLGESTVAVARDGSFLRLGDEEVSFSRKPVARQLLAVLVEALEARATVDLDTLLAAAWPGDRGRPESARNRLYVALTALRKLGLRDVLQRNEQGWYLDPTVEIVPVEKT